MLFRLFAITALAASAAAQAISADKTVKNIQQITTESSDLNKKAQKVTLLNGFQTGPEVIQGFHQIVKTGTKAYNEMKGSSSKKAKRVEGAGGSIAARAVEAKRQDKPYTAAEQQAVCDAFIDFVGVHQTLLATMIGKHGILEVTGVAYQTAAVLRGVEGVVDEIAFTLIAEIPNCADKANAQKAALDKSLSKAIDTYANGLP